MNFYEIVYVSFAFKNENDENVEKTKKHLIKGESEKDAEINFLNKKIKFKKIKSIVICNSNNLLNNCPNLYDIFEKMNK